MPTFASNAPILVEHVHKSSRPIVLRVLRYEWDKFGATEIVSCSEPRLCGRQFPTLRQAANNVYMMLRLQYNHVAYLENFKAFVTTERADDAPLLARAARVDVRGIHALAREASFAGLRLAQRGPEERAGAVELPAEQRLARDEVLFRVGLLDACPRCGHTDNESKALDGLAGEEQRARHLRNCTDVAAHARYAAKMGKQADKVAAAERSEKKQEEVERLAGWKFLGGGAHVCTWDSNPRASCVACVLRPPARLNHVLAGRLDAY